MGNEDDYKKLEDFYSTYLGTFKNGQVPKSVKSRNGTVLSFDEILVKVCNKFEKSKQLSALVDLFKSKP